MGHSAGTGSLRPSKYRSHTGPDRLAGAPSKVSLSDSHGRRAQLVNAPRLCAWLVRSLSRRRLWWIANSRSTRTIAERKRQRPEMPTVLRLDPSRAERSCQAGDRESRRFRDNMENCAWVAGSATMTNGIAQTRRLECDMNQEAHCNNGRLRRQTRRQIATTLVRLLACLLAASCVVAQTGKLSAE